MPRPLGWTFRTDDPFIIAFRAENGSFPVVTEDVKLRELHTMAPAVTLILSVLFSGITLVLFGIEPFIKTTRHLSQAKVMLMLVAVSGDVLGRE